MLLFLNVSFVIVLALLGVVLLLQPMKQDGSVNDFEGKGVRVFTNRRKVHGVDLFFKRTTFILIILFFALSIIHIFI